MTTFKEKLATWQGGEDGFYQWLDDIQPRILARSNRYELFKPTAKQKRFIKQVLAVDRAGRFKHSIALNIEPRRHGKSTVFALIVLWLFTSRQNHTTQLLGSTEDHTRRTQFATLRKIINHTPKLLKIIPERNHFSYTIVFPEMDNQIQFAASNTASSFGDKISVLWVSDLHSFIDLGPFNAMQASLLDSEDSLLLIDSNVDETDGVVHSLEKEAAADSTMFCQSTSYRDLDHYCKAAPAWIDRKKARRLEKTSLPAAFKRDILGQRSDVKNALFSAEIINSAMDDYRVPVDDINSLVQGRAYRVGGALDRAKSLIATGRGDFSVWTTLAKVAAADGGEPEYFVLNQARFKVNTARAIKKVILEDHQKYKLDNVVLENFETADLHSWMVEQKIPCELISPHSTVQNASFPEMYRIFKEGRFHFPSELEVFASELGTFTYTKKQNDIYSFGHSSSKFHDDTVYSTNWAIFSLRREVLNLFELADINCFNRSRHRHHCFLMGGNLELHCKKDCQAYDQVAGMWRQYRSFEVESEITLPDFFHSFVKVSGAVFYQSA